MVQKARKLMEDDKLSAEEAARVLKVSRRTLFGGWPQRGSMMR
jgi:DNA-binding XRE family transcriptional regulator